MSDANPARPTARTGEKRPIDPFLGQHRMVADPRISAVQAAAILGCPIRPPRASDH